MDYETFVEVFKWNQPRADDVHILQFIMKFYDSIYLEQQHAVEVASEYRSFKILDWLFSAYPDLFTDNAVVESMYTAAKRGKINVLKWFRKTLDTEFVRDVRMNLLMYASCNGYVETTNYILRRMIRKMWDRSDVFIATASCGQLKCLKLLGEFNKATIKTACIEAVKGGHYTTVVWLHKTYFTYPYIEAAEVAARYGHINILKYLFRLNVRSTAKNLMMEAIRGGQLGVVKFLRSTYDKRYDLCYLICMAAMFKQKNIEMYLWRLLGDEDGFVVVRNF